MSSLSVGLVHRTGPLKGLASLSSEPVTTSDFLGQPNRFPGQKRQADRRGGDKVPDGGIG